MEQSTVESSRHVFLAGLLGSALTGAARDIKVFEVDGVRLRRARICDHDGESVTVLNLRRRPWARTSLSRNQALCYRAELISVIGHPAFDFRMRSRCTGKKATVLPLIVYAMGRPSGRAPRSNA
jgi:hypothetical protein